MLRCLPPFEQLLLRPFEGSLQAVTAKGPTTGRPPFRTSPLPFGLLRLLLPVRRQNGAARTLWRRDRCSVRWLLSDLVQYRRQERITSSYEIKTGTCGTDATAQPAVRS